MTGAGASDGESGQPWKGFDPTAKDRHWAVPTFLRDQLPADKARVGVLERLDTLYDMGLIEIKEGAEWPHPVRYLKPGDGQPLQDIWAYQPYTSETLFGTDEGIDEDVMWLGPTTPERLDYKTQKPLGLLKRIINVSTDSGDVVFDPFCGCATTLEAAHSLNRKWIGIDIAIHAIKRVAKIRLQERLRLVENEHFTIEGVPQNIEGARDLWRRDKYHFQKWAAEQVDGFVTTRQSGDGGVDGRIYFAMPEDDSFTRRGLESMAIEVKGGKNVGINVMRELSGVLDDDAALMAGLIILEPLGEQKERNFRKFMASKGDLDVLGMKYARLQMLTVGEILEGKRFLTPGAVGRVDQSALPLTGEHDR